MKRLGLALALLPALACAQDMVTRDGVTLTPTQEAQAEDIGGQLRCLVCQNESVEDSGAKLAGQLRTIIRQQVVAGDSAPQIMDGMVHRYGIFVLLKPPVSPLTALLYAMPALALLAGGAAFWAARRRGAEAKPLTETEATRLKELL